jgi:hypothetical protein
MTLHKQRPLHYKLVMLITHTCNFCYYIIDHVLWGVNIGVFEGKEHLKPIAKAIKDSSSLAKALLKLFNILFDYHMIFK